jgi:hypothetical protein
MLLASIRLAFAPDVQGRLFIHRWCDPLIPRL